MKKVLLVLLVLVMVVATMIVFRDAIVKFSVQKAVAIVTGLKIDIGNLHIGIVKPVVHIRDLKLFNPDHFIDRVMVDIPEIYVDYHLPSIVGRKFYFPQIRLSVKEVVVIKSAQGELNLDALKSVQAQKKDPKGERSQEPKKTGPMPQIKVDELHLDIGRVVYKDYSKKSDPEIMMFNINLKEVYHDVNDPFVLVNLIITRALANTTISSLIKFDLRTLKSAVGGVVSGTGNAVSTAVSGVKETGKQAVDTMKGLLLSPFKKE